jgi:hypothetical protein
MRARSLDLSLDLLSAVEDTAYYPDKPAGESWYRVTTFVDLFLLADNPNALDGSGITNLVVNSEQDFVLRRDPGGSGRYLVCRQMDLEPIRKSDAVRANAVEEASWGKLKKLFR